MSIVDLRPRRDKSCRIAVFRALQLGDMLCAVPALRAVRSAFPEGEITLIGLPWAGAFAQRFAHLVDRFVEFPGFPGLPEREPDIAAVPDFLRTAQAADYHLAIQMHGSGEISNAIVATLGARITAGFHPPQGPCPDRLRFLPWPAAGREIHRCLALTSFLGFESAGDRLEFPIDAEERSAARSLLARHHLVPRRFVCVHPGARLYSRRWPPEYFAAVARDALALGYRVALTGSAEETLLTRRVARDLAPSMVVDLAGQTTLGVLGALLAHARLLICNDTGVSHVAAALAVPSVVVCCGADPLRFAPIDQVLHEVLHHPIGCRPCAHVHCPIGHPCAQKLDPTRVGSRVRARLGSGRPGAPRDVAHRLHPVPPPSPWRTPPNA
ncbi:MAG TPA: glycosyltransferase family 9 protein [Casimicrobiaceae bacterium]|nr:glycosyltransferase family 9 protein [Casimicrobiaceae bacterium]